MELSDPFAPAFQSENGVQVDLPDHWMTSFPADQPTPEAEPAASFGSVEPQPAPAASPVTTSGDIDRAKQIVEQVTNSLKDLTGSLEATEAERHAWMQERDQLNERIQELEVEAGRRRKFTEALTSGTGASITTDDLTALQGMTDALTQDPDRLTVLFNVVQQAAKLATVVTVYSEVRRLAEDA